MQFAQGHTSKKITDILSVATPIGVFVVNTMGFIDTDTGSALGCGRQWPLCNNQLIPSSFDLHTLIEFGHRGLVGLVSILLISFGVFAWANYGHFIEVRVLSLISVGFVVVEALLGALGVLFGDPPAELATHFGVSLIAFAAVLLLHIVISQIKSHTHDGTTHELMPLRPHAVTKSYESVVWFTFSYLYVAMYIGAYVASSGAADSFSGLVVPAESLQTPHHALWIDLLHRTIAAGLLLLIVHLVVQSYKLRAQRPDLWKGSLAALTFTILQIAAGIFLIESHISLIAQILHTAVVTALFGVICYMALQVLPEPLARSKQASDTLVPEH